MDPFHSCAIEVLSQALKLAQEERLKSLSIIAVSIDDKEGQEFVMSGAMSPGYVAQSQVTPSNKFHWRQRVNRAG